MQPRDIVLSQIHHHETPVIPFSLPMESDVAARVDQYYGSPAWRRKLDQYFCTVAAVDTDIKTPLSATRVQDPYGGVWRTDKLPWHLETPPLAKPSFEGYQFPKPEKFLRPDAKARAFVTCRECVDRFRIGSLGWGLFERSWNLRGFENILIDALDEQDFFEEALDRLLDLYLTFVHYTAELPIDGILFGDDWGDQRGIILGAERWRRFLKPRWARIYAEVRRAGKLVMHHSCGSVAEIMPDLIEIGVDVLESVQPEAAGMNPYELKRQWGDKITFWGCLGSQSTLPFATPAEIRAEVKKLCREMGQGGGYLLAPAKPLQIETPTENAVAAIEAFTEQGG